MTYSKSSSKSEISICSWKISRKYVANAIKGCLCLLLVCCFVLATVTISRANLRTKTSQIQNFHPAPQSESRMLQKTQLKYMPTACRILNCTIQCFDAKKIYDEVYEVLQSTVCEENITLKIDTQHFPNSILTNGWKPARKVIKSIVIENSDIKHIRNEAFNSFDFTTTEALIFLGVRLNKLTNGVLLGFAKLQFLRLEGRVQQVDRCFFQPVQATLMRLTLRAKLKISGKNNIFGISYMSNMSVLDLSENIITGSLSRRFFLAVPCLKFLTLSNSEIASIEIDAFDDIASGLLLLDLSNNRLLNLDVRSLEHILASGIANIYLLGNEWLCECQLKPLISLYEEYEDQFGDVPYCKSPLSFYGVLFTNVKFDEDCKAEQQIKETLLATPIDHYTKTDSLRTTSSSTEASVSNTGSSFKMACMSIISLEDAQETLSEDNSFEYFVFAPPCHDFELILLQNNSVQVVVQYADEPINIIWFSEAVEKFVHTVNGITIDYNCELYSDPFLLAEDLVENCTYTFCLVPSGTFSITPFNCLPLHVPSKVKPEPNVWISHDEKELTLGIVCLILMCSLIFGGVVAYFGIKAYPDILEGSNHVLVVKKSNKTASYVSTITEGEYAIHKNSLKKKNTSTLQMARIETLPPSVLLYKDTEQIKDESSQEAEDYYEMPCIYNKTHNCQQKCSFNKCVTTPSSPPPLPKRNSDSTLYNSASELISDVPYPKLSL